MQNRNLVSGIRLRLSIFGLLLVLTSSCVFTSNPKQNTSHISVLTASALDRDLESILKKHKINTAGIAIIKNGNVAWQGYFGQQSSEVPASANTLFNVASITKTVTAETVLKLVSQGKISLDESMANYWVDPDLKNDPELSKLTPRMALTHTTGFPNWRFYEID